MNPYKELANAVIVQAVKDYRDEVLWLRAHKPVLPDDEESLEYRNHTREKKSIERFFRSGWFSVLSDLDGKTLLQMLKKECDAA